MSTKTDTFYSLKNEIFLFSKKTIEKPNSYISSMVILFSTHKCMHFVIKIYNKSDKDVTSKFLNYPLSILEILL